MSRRKTNHCPSLRRPRGDYRQMVLSIPASVKRAMRGYLAVNWSEVATRAFSVALYKLERGDQP